MGERTSGVGQNANGTNCREADKGRRTHQGMP